MANFSGRVDYQYGRIATNETPTARSKTADHPPTLLRQHSPAFIHDRYRAANMLANSPSARLSAARSAEELTDRDHRPRQVPSYQYDDHSDIAAPRRQISSFPYHFPYQPSPGPVLALEELPTLLSPTRLVRPPAASAAASAYKSASLSSASSSAQPSQRRQPKTIEEKRVARQCSVDGCTNYTIDRGRCFRHGGGKTCAVEDCGRSAKARGLCWRHGGSVRCTVEGCDRGAKSKGLCWSHGGGNQCSIDGCQKTIISKGLCWTHGGGKRCTFDGCMRPASGSKQNFCNRHHAEFSDGNTVYEV